MSDWRALVAVIDRRSLGDVTKRERVVVQSFRTLPLIASCDSFGVAVGRTVFAFPPSMI